jgi:hypothetical protein
MVLTCLINISIFLKLDLGFNAHQTHALYITFYNDATLHHPIIQYPLFLIELIMLMLIHGAFNSICIVKGQVLLLILNLSFIHCNRGALCCLNELINRPICHCMPRI